jgi:thiol-disulfide isomerase/thioredoxin
MLAVLLALALFVALRPELDAGGSGDPSGAGDPNGAGATVAGGTGAEPADDLGRLRTRAALQPCPSSASAPRVEGPLSGVVLPCLGAPGQVDMARALAGRPAVLNLWGPMCRPCAEELPALAAYAAQPDAVQVLGVEVQKMPEGALDMLATLHVRYPSVSDPDGRLRAALGTPPVLPMTYVVAADGRVSQVNPPEVMRSAEQVRAVVKRYLGPGVPG